MIPSAYAEMQNNMNQKQLRSIMQLNITCQVKNIGINIDIKEGLNLCFIKHIAAWVFILAKVLGE